MRSYLPVFLGMIGILALGATIWILFAGSESNGDIDSNVLSGEQAEGFENKKVIGADFVEESSPESQVELLPDVPRTPKKEQVLPAFKAVYQRGALTVRVVHLSDGSPVPPEELKLSFFFNDIPFDRDPDVSPKTSSYRFDQLLPGRYRADVVTTDWKRGSATCLLGIESHAELLVSVAMPDALAMRVIDADTREPVQNARLEARGFIQGGLTDKNGMFLSARKYTPDNDLSIQITHPSYFSTLFEPGNPSVSGATVQGNDRVFQVKMTPLSGDLTFSGVIVDGEGVPVSRLALFLSPDDPQGGSRVLTTYSDRSGTFRFDRLTPGRYVLSATLRFLVSRYMKRPPMLFEIAYALLPGQNLEDRIVTYTMPQIPFRGQVFQADSSQPVDGAEVAYISSSRGMSNRYNSTGGSDPLFFETVTTDSEGSFQTARMFTPEEIYRMVVYGNVQITSKSGIKAICRPQKTPEGLRQMQADIMLNQPIMLWIVEQGDLMLTGRVLDDQGIPLAGVRVTAESALDISQGRMRGYTNEDGSFSVSHLFPGRWVLSLMVPRGPTLQHAVTLSDDGKVPEVVIRLDRSCTLEGRILFEQVPGRWQIRVRGLDYETESQKIGSDLWYSFHHLPPGKAQVILETYEGKRYQESFLDVWEAWVDLQPGKVVRQDFSF